MTDLLPDIDMPPQEEEPLITDIVSSQEDIKENITAEIKEVDVEPVVQNMEVGEYSANDLVDDKFYKPMLFTIEDTSMSKPIFQAIRAEMRRRNEFIIPFKEEKPGTRMSKRDRIQEILAQRFAVGQIHIKKTQYDLHREVITFGPRMAHDDTIDALAYACKYAHPPKGLEENRGSWTKRKRKPKSWVTA